jgi:hypothetical protein
MVAPPATSADFSWWRRPIVLYPDPPPFERPPPWNPGVFMTVLTFTGSPPATTWRPPAGVTSVYVDAWGAGGGGGSSSPSGLGGGGGGGGAYARGLVSVNPALPYVVQPGNGGFGGSNPQTGGQGDNAIFGDVSTVMAKGGGPGGGGNAGVAGGGGVRGTASGSVGNITTIDGGNGGSGVSNPGGGGGSSAGNTAVGAVGGDSSGATEGAGGIAPFPGGNGGSGGKVQQTGHDGTVPGGGGGGGGLPIAGWANGGAGANGKIVLTFASSSPSYPDQFEWMLKWKPLFPPDFEYLGAQHSLAFIFSTMAPPPPYVETYGWVQHRPSDDSFAKKFEALPTQITWRAMFSPQQAPPAAPEGYAWIRRVPKEGSFSVPFEPLPNQVTWRPMFSPQQGPPSYVETYAWINRKPNENSFWQPQPPLVLPPPWIGWFVPQVSPSLALSGIGLISRDPQADERTRRHLDQVSSLLNSLLTQGYIVATGVQAFKIVGGGVSMNRAPNVMDDAAHGFPVGVLWVQTSPAVHVWVNVSNAVGAAVWQLLV